MKRGAFCSNMIAELGFEEGFSRVQLYLDNTSTLHIAGNRTYSLRLKHIALLWYFFVQELAEKGKMAIQYVNTQDPLAELGTKHYVGIVTVLSSNSSKPSRPEQHFMRVSDVVTFLVRFYCIMCVVRFFS